MHQCSDPNADEARHLDENDALARFMGEFYQVPNTIYLNGNSLGLMSETARSSLLKVVDEWQNLAIRGWMSAPVPWSDMGETLGRQMEGLIGARSGEVVVTGSTTVNIHALVASFYRPAGARRKILATAVDFPSDIHALQGQLVLRYGQKGKDLLLKAPTHDGWTVREEDIVELMTDEVALVFLPSVHYGSGQLSNMEFLAKEARSRGITLGLDLSHSIGILPHHLSHWGINFALWCNYKWLNGGPGAPGGLYVNRDNHENAPVLRGWWGYKKEKQFLMKHDFEPAAGAGGFQISTPSMLSMAPLEGALALVNEAGIQQIRNKSLGLTRYLLALADRHLIDRGFSVVTPRDDHRRGGHIALSHPRAKEINVEMDRHGIIADFRPPSVIRLAPSPLYTSYQEIFQAVHTIAGIVDDLLHSKGSGN